MSQRDTRSFAERKAEAERFSAEHYSGGSIAPIHRERVPEHDASPEQRLRNRIEAAKSRAAADPNANEGETLKDLRRQHYERTRSSGG